MLSLTPSCLKWTNSHGRHEYYALAGFETIIGRGAHADLKLIERNVSRRHVRIARDEHGYLLFDLGSSHGTYVNAQRIDQCRLRHGDRIRMGRDGIELVYLLQDAATTDVTDITKGFDMEKSLQNLATLLPVRDSPVSELEKISCLLDFQCYWGKTFSPEKTFLQILKSSLQIVGAERGFILLKEPEGFVYQAGMDGSGALLPQSDFRASQSVVRHVAEREKPVFMTQEIGGDFAQQESIVAMKLRALACLPLVAISSDSENPHVMGILYLDSTKKMHSLSGLDEKIMTRLAEQAGTVLEKLEMIKNLEAQKKIQDELILARETQRSLLPRTLPQRATLLVHAFNHPTRHVGGDLYDFLTLDSGELVGVLADVAGKGVPAALLSSLLLGALNIEFFSSSQPAVVLNRINKLVCEKSSSNQFITLFLFLVDSRGMGQYISAGHNPAYLYRAATGEIEELGAGGLILGAFDFVKYEAKPLQLSDGDVLVVYSDGFTDAENPDGEMFGEERLREVIRSEGQHGTQVLERKLLEELENFTRGIGQTDDITFVLLEKRPEEEGLREEAEARAARGESGEEPPTSDFESDTDEGPVWKIGDYY